MDTPSPGDEQMDISRLKTEAELRDAALFTLRAQLAASQASRGSARGGADQAGSSSASVLAGEALGSPVEFSASKPVDDFDALLLQYQSEANGIAREPQEYGAATSVYSEIPDHQTYYDHDSGQTLYGAGQLSSAAAPPAFGATAAYSNRDAAYQYQGLPWSNADTSYFPGPVNTLQPDHSTFGLLNQYHMQLRMLTSPLPRQHGNHATGSARGYASARSSQPTYSLPFLPPGAHSSYQMPPLSSESGLEAMPHEHASRESDPPFEDILVGDSDTAPVRYPVACSPSGGDRVLSDGELDPLDDDFIFELSGNYAKQRTGPVNFALSPSGSPRSKAASLSDQSDDQQDVEGIVKLRLGVMLKMKDPKLLQGAPFRAHMLMLKCIKLDDPDDIYAAVKSAPPLVVSELNLLSAEFGLVMVTEACVNTLLATGSDDLNANLRLGEAEAEAAAKAAAGSSDYGLVMAEPTEKQKLLPMLHDHSQDCNEDWSHAPTSDSDSMDMELKSSSGECESPAPNSDMDTSSDVDYEYSPSLAESLSHDNALSALRTDTQPMRLLSRETTPQFHLRFSRSRAPSPPSAQPRTPRRFSNAKRSPTPFDRDASEHTLIGGSARSINSGASTESTRLLGSSSHGWPVRLHESLETADSFVQSTVCASEGDQLVVYLESSDRDSGSSSDCDSESSVDTSMVAMTGTTSSLHAARAGARARDKALRLENRRLNESCRQLAREEDQPANHSSGYGAAPRSSSGLGVSSSTSRVSTPAYLNKAAPNDALLKAKESVKAQEAAIARLKMEISRKQTKMLLRKRLHESRLRRAHELASAASAPVTPCENGSEPTTPLHQPGDAGVIYSQQGRDPATGTLLGIPALDGELAGEAGSQPSDGPLGDSASDAAISMENATLPDCSVGRADADSACKPILPESSACESLIQNAPSKIRSAFLAGIMTLLKGTINSKNSELRSIMRGAGTMTQRDLDTLKQRASQTDEQLLSRKSRLDTHRGNICNRIRDLQAELGLVDLETDILSYSQDANRGYWATLDPAAPSSNDALPIDRGGRAVCLRNEITAVHQLMDSMFRVADTLTDAGSVLKDQLASASDHAPTQSSAPSSAVTADPAPDSNTVQQLSAPPCPQRDLSALRNRLVSMKQTQDTLSVKLTNLVQKRKGTKSESPLLPDTKRPRIPTSTTVETPSPTSSASPKHSSVVKDILAVVRSEAAKHARESLPKQCRPLLMLADSCILQPLILVDGVGLPDIAKLNHGLLSGVVLSKGQGSGSTYSTARIVKDANSASTAMLAYVPYESPIGLSAAMGCTSTDSPPLDTDPATLFSIDVPSHLPRLSTANLIELAKLWPNVSPHLAEQYHAEAIAVLESIKPSPDGTASNKVIARAIMPLVYKYSRFINKVGMSKTNPLSKLVRSRENINSSGLFSPFASGKAAEYITNAQYAQLKAAVNEAAGFPPLLSRDVAQMTFSLAMAQQRRRQQKRERLANSSQQQKRYYDVADINRDFFGESKAEDGSSSDSSSMSDSDSESLEDVVAADSSSINDCETTNHDSISVVDDGETEAKAETAGSDDSPDVRYRHALRLLWQGFPKSDRMPTESDILTYLHASANKSVGNAVMYLKQSLQAHPCSEKLWDLCLELFVRQPVKTSEIVSAFRDATTFNARSTCLWQRYLSWCCWSIAHKVSVQSDRAIWRARLSTVAASAVANLVGQQQAPPAGHISALLTIAIVSFWKGMWALLERQVATFAHTDAAQESARLKAQLISGMSGLLRAKTSQELNALISGADADVCSQGGPDFIDNCGWSVDEMVLAQLLLPHHLLLVGQVFVHCFVAGSFVPESVLAQMLAALSTSTGRPTVAYFVSSEKIVEVFPAAVVKEGTLKRHIADVVVGLMSALRGAIHLHILTATPQAANPVIHLSKAICKASVNLTLAQLKTHRSAKAVLNANDLDSLLHRISRNPLGTLDIQTLPASITRLGLNRFLLVTHILCQADLGCSDYSPCERAVYILREHAILIAEHFGAVPCGVKSATWRNSDSSDDPDLKSRLQQWISDCQALYYGIFGYAGSSPPKSLEALSFGLLGNTKDGNSARARLLRLSGIWINIALIEYMKARLDAGNQSIEAQALDSALLWLSYGLNHHEFFGSGTRSQMWVVFLQLTMIKRSLTLKDIMLVHRDLCVTDDLNTLHVSPPNFYLMSGVLRVVMETATYETLEAIGSYLTHVAPTNADLAFRFIVQATVSGKPAFSLRGLFHQVVQHNSTDPLLAEM